MISYNLFKKNDFLNFFHCYVAAVAPQNKYDQGIDETIDQAIKLAQNHIAQENDKFGIFNVFF